MDVGGAPTPPNRLRGQVRWEDNYHGDSKQQTLPCSCQAATGVGTRGRAAAGFGELP